MAKENDDKKIVTPTDGDQASQVEAEEDVDKSGGDKPSPDGPGGDKPSRVDELPDWARSEIESLRKEAAERRIAQKDLQEKFASAKTEEEFSAAVADANKRAEEIETQLTSLRNRSAVRSEFASMPDELFAYVTGDTVEDLRKSAETLSKFSPQPHGPIRRSPSGGLTPGEPGEPDADVKELVKRIPR